MAAAWLMNLGFAAGTASVSGVVTSTQYSLIGSESRNQTLLGTDDRSLSLIGTEDRNQSLIGA